jgi:polar amino acid transport system substrate-binding protein
MERGIAVKRRLLIGAVLVGLLALACAEETTSPGASGGSTQGCDLSDPPLFQEGQLTVATDRPAYPPWFVGKPGRYKGYEGDQIGRAHV